MKRHRIDYLAIDRSLLQRCSPVPPTKFALSKSSGWEIFPLDQKFPNAYTPARQVLYSCNKIGANLFVWNDLDFDLRDPYMNHSHAAVEYNELHDPALESYYRRPGMRKRLQALNLVNDKNDVICSRKYFFQYLRLLESRRSAKLLKALTHEHTERITTHLSELKKSKQNVRRLSDCQVQGSRQMRYREAENKRRLKIKKSKLKIEKSLQRFQRTKEVKSKDMRQRSHTQRMEFELRAQKLCALEAARKVEMNTIFNAKSDLAALRKTMVQLNAQNARMQKEAELATIQYVQREESRILSTYLVHCRETEMCDNILKRIKQIEEENKVINDRMEKLKVDVIKRAYEKKTAAKITYEFMLHIKSKLIKKTKNLNAADDEELFRRYFTLTEKNVANCVNLAFEILTSLDAPHSTSDIICVAARLLLRIAITIPGFDMPSGSIEKRIVFEMTGETLSEIKNIHLEKIAGFWNEQLTPDTKKIEASYDDDDVDEHFYETGAKFVIDSPKTIGEPAYWDYMKGMKSVVGRRPTPILNLRALVRNEMTELFDIIDNENFTYPGTMDTRDLMHLQDFQKCILAKNFGFLGHFVKLKMEQYLSRSFVTRQIERPDLNRDILVLKISEYMLTFPVNCMHLTRAIRTIGKIICAEIHDSVRFSYALRDSFAP